MRASSVGCVASQLQPSSPRRVDNETGFVNLVVWERVFTQHHTVAQTASFLGVTGKLQVQDGVVHVVAENLWVPKLAHRLARTRSRDFH